ncbi:MAG: knotted carbamoyltransferase YgeW [Acidobacteriota bacterium]
MDEIFKNMDKIKSGLFGKDFLLTWEKEVNDLKMILYIAESLIGLREKNISSKCFDSGLAVSLFRDKSTRTRFSFASASNLLGLEVQDLDEEKSQIAHGETVRETANMISFMTEIIGIRDDMFLGEGNRFMREVGDALDEGFREGVLPRRPGIINLQCDIDHPTQSMADLLHLKKYFGSLEALKGKKLAMTWAYSPSYGKPLSVPQGIIGLMTRLGMEVSLAYPEGYDLIEDVNNVALSNSVEYGGKFTRVSSMEEAFEGADIVYPKSWAPYSTMVERTELLKNEDKKGLEDLEIKSLENNKKFMDWECDEKKMALTKGGEGLYMHCLPADISDVSCARGEVTSKVFEKYRLDTYREAGYKPYIIAAMMIANKFRDPLKLMEKLLKSGRERILENI